MPVARFKAHYGALCGGVSRSLSLDNDGKALCAAILAIDVDVPDGLEVWRMAAS